MVVSDNGTELTSHAVLARCQDTRGRMALHRAAQGSPELVEGPQRNGFVESFNGRLRDKRLNAHLFPSLATARRIIEAWQTGYNTVRPHSSLGGLAPAEFTNRPRQGIRTPKLSYQRPETGSR
jgi:putative transposase